MKFKIIITSIVVLETIIIAFLLPYPKIITFLLPYFGNASNFVIALSSPLVAGLVIWFLGEHVANKRIKQDAITELMTYRGADYADDKFRQALNKIAIVFHGDSEIRKDVRHLYEVLNNASLRGKIANRTIVGLIYNLCQRNGIKGLSEYDIDQSFLDTESQTPPASTETPKSIIEEKPLTKRTRKRSKKK